MVKLRYFILSNNNKKKYKYICKIFFFFENVIFYLLLFIFITFEILPELLSYIELDKTLLTFFLLKVNNVEHSILILKAA